MYMKALFDSLVRTVVPIVVGSVLSWFTMAGIEVDAELKANLTVALTVGFTSVYYIGVRLLETYVAPKFGWLLGLAKSPVYVATESPAGKTDIVVTQAPAAGATGEVVVQSTPTPMDVQAVAAVPAEVAETGPIPTLEATTFEPDIFYKHIADGAIQTQDIATIDLSEFKKDDPLQEV